MSENKELVIYYDKKLMQNGWMYFPIFIAVALYMHSYGIYNLWNSIANILFFHFRMSLWLLNDIGYYVMSFVQMLMIVLIILLIVALMYNVFLTVDDKPLAVFNSNGVWVKHFGLIPWDNIIEVAPYLNFPPSVEVIGIRVKNTSLLSKQATTSGKLGIFYSKQFGYPPIIISNITGDIHEAISFAQQFIK